MDCGDCSWIVEIAVGLQRLQLDCRDCSWIAEIEHYQKMSSHAENLPQGAEKEPSFGGRMSGGLWSAAKH